MEIPKTYTRNEVAEILHVSPRTIDNYIKSNKLKAVKLNARKVLVKEEDFKAFLDNYIKEK